MSKNGKLFLFSERSNIIVETSIDKIYTKDNNSRLGYKEVDPKEYGEPFNNFIKIVYVSEDSFNEMLNGTNKRGNKIISAIVKIGHSDDKKHSFFSKIKNIFKRKKSYGKVR